jgi:hypothetical protein
MVPLLKKSQFSHLVSRHVSCPSHMTNLPPVEIRQNIQRFPNNIVEVASIGTLPGNSLNHLQCIPFQHYRLQAQKQTKFCTQSSSKSLRHRRVGNITVKRALNPQDLAVGVSGYNPNPYHPLLRINRSIPIQLKSSLLRFRPLKR